MAPRDWPRLLHEAFEVGIAAKALFALVETLAGLGLLVLQNGWLQAVARWLTAGELGEDPADPLARWVMAAAGAFSLSTQHFWAIYLVGHGLIKLAAVGALVAGFRWAYPLSMAVLGGFIFWQMQKWAATGSVSMLALSVFDLAVIWLIWHEWRSLPD
ncbi:DUF2127 domain-containing protein [Albidovulum sp.]|uniref:DUF2127 domain-containing protein n=1 Tax=Albidovulum sp. TaxID=1872424 RepID=UPI001D7A3FF3|nr:DUF2127 domain-containing protein [Paracoccaceae bacterium]